MADEGSDILKRNDNLSDSNVADKTKPEQDEIEYDDVS